ncbi:MULTISPECIES: glycine betaine ABC transporter substrate-binding protein [unclassified Arthrobacter]|uniref:glycine betaine ABC transporter substrate-binding protein n=1 Tax=unclassified Arthrobacter TaxID=235627 RepID=UPI002E0B224D|nr:MULTISPECIES: glycine betaine ABC transporter substrate-binding protein [unclassified Arthrobacter]MEC5192361.1 osmoprotectant transport system substrate-binding protein [Arthrobacter sp. MP_M4]MEC5203846.1 osmoprotectant transport system substrate-binding protein [Arthrobacter sp. MP_M7]
MKKPVLALLATGVAAVLSLTACGGGATSATSDAKGKELDGLTGVIGAKDFSEQFILSHITSQLLNAHGAQTTTNTKVVGSANVRTAFESGQFAGYWEYTGTSWITYNKETTPLKDKKEMFDAVKTVDAKKGIAWLDPAPLNNTYAFAIREDKAKELNVTSLSDIAKLPASEQTFCMESEFSTRDDGWPGLKKEYGLSPDAKVAMLDTGVIYTATQKGQDCNFGEVFETDGRISSLKLQVMKDDKNFFPIYQGALTIKADMLAKYPAIADIMSKVSPKLTTEVMQQLNAKADVDGDDPEQIAKDWLTSEGLI